MLLTFVSCLLRPWTAPAVAEPVADSQAPEEVLVVWPQAKVFLFPQEEGDTVEAAINGGALHSVPGFIRAPAEEGDYWLAAASRDRAGNVSRLRWIRLRVDGKAPDIQIRFSPEAFKDAEGRFWVRPAGRVVASATDGVAGVGELTLAVAENELAVHQRDEVSLDVPETDSIGPLTVRSHAMDRVGNVSEEQTVEVFIDGRPPRGSLRISGSQISNELGLVVGPAVGVTADIGDSESGVRQWAPSLNRTKTTMDVWRGPWTSGDYQATAAATDNTGNEAIIGPLAFVVDADPPEIKWDVKGASSLEKDGLWFHKSPVEVTVRAGDGAAGVESVEWSQDGETWNTYDQTLATRNERLHFRATDRVGNRAEVVASWRVDDEPPDVFIRTADDRRHAPGGQVQVAVGQQIRILAVDTGSGVDAIQVAHPWRRSSATERFSFLTPGQRLFRVEARDALGNATRAQWLLIVSDKVRSSKESR